MPWKTMTEVPGNLKSIDGVPLTLDQTNLVALWAAAVEREGGADDPWAAAIAKFKKMFEAAEDRWSPREGAAAGATNIEGENSMEPDEKQTENLPACAAPEIFDIPGVEIFRAGAWTDSAGRTISYSPADISAIAAAHRELEGRLEPPVKLGHDPEQPLLRADGLPAAGWLRNVRAAGGRLYADLSGVPRKVFDLIRAGAYKKRSLEVLHQYRDESTGRVYPHVAAGLALLGARLPAIGSLADIRALYESATGAAAYLYTSGPAGILEEPAAGQSNENDEENETMDQKQLEEKIAALEARIAELELLLEESVETEDEIEAESAQQVAEEPLSAPDVDNATDASNTTPDEADSTGDIRPVLVIADTVTAPVEVDTAEPQDVVASETEPEETAPPAETEEEEPIEGTPIESFEDEPAAEEPAGDENVETAGEQESAEELIESAEEGLPAAEEQTETEEPAPGGPALEAAMDSLQAAMEELEIYKQRETAARGRARRDFIDRNSRRIPPAFRGLVLDLLAILDGDATDISGYSRTRHDSEPQDIASGFRSFLSALAEHPAVSEYGTENCECETYSAADDESGDIDERIRKYCVAHCLDPEDASDYSKAAAVVLKYEVPPEKNNNAVMRNSNIGADSSSCNSCGIEYNRLLEEASETEDGIQIKSCYMNGLKEKLKGGIEAAKEIGKSKIGKIGTRCPDNTKWIEPAGELALIHTYDRRIGIFKGGCCGLTEYSSYYAMNEIAKCAMKKPLDRNHINSCLMRYVEFRNEGRRVFFDGQ